MTISDGPEHFIRHGIATPPRVLPIDGDGVPVATLQTESLFAVLYVVRESASLAVPDSEVEVWEREAGKWMRRSSIGGSWVGPWRHRPRGEEVLWMGLSALVTSATTGLRYLVTGGQAGDAVKGFLLRSPRVDRIEPVVSPIGAFLIAGPTPPTFSATPVLKDGVERGRPAAARTLGFER